MNLLFEAAVDFLHDLVDSGQQPREQFDRPLLQRLGHDGMVGIRAGFLHDRPRVIPRKAVFVQKNPHQFRHRQRRMRVVHLENNLLRQLMNVVISGHELLQRALDRSGNKEILLLQPQFLSLNMIVAGVQNLADRASKVLLFNRLLIIALVEGIQMEAVDRLRVPDAERIHKAVSVTDDRHVIRNRLDCVITFLTENRPSVLIHMAGHIAAEMNFLCILGSSELERISVLEPVVRNLDLISVADLLLEHAVAVADAAAVSRIVQRGEGIEEACGKSSETAVSKRRIRLLVLNLVHVKAKLFQSFADRLERLQVNHVIAECPAHQEFH